jgi:hypothetical protein
MRKVVLTVTLAATVLVACIQSPAHRFLRRYYDPSGNFSAALPITNATEAAKAGSSLGQGLQLISGVTSSPPQQSMPRSVGFAPPDQSTFLVWAIAADTPFASSADVANILTKDPSMDVQVSRTFRFVDGAGSLVSGSYTTDRGAFGIAGGFLEVDGIGYAVIEEYPSGQWDAQRWDFEDVLTSFHARTPPGLDTIDLGSG